MTLRLQQSCEAQPGGRWLWAVWLEGPTEEIARVAEVQYTLHPTFIPRVRTVTNRRTKFRLKASGWGEFRIYAEVRHTNGTKLNLEHWLHLQAETSASASAQAEQDRKAALVAADRPTVFVSYSIDDSPFGIRLCRALAGKGLEVLTTNDLESGVGLEAAMGLLLRRVDAAVFVISAVPNPGLQSELLAGQRLNLPLLPVLLGPTPATGEVGGSGLKATPTPTWASSPGFAESPTRQPAVARGKLPELLSRNGLKVTGVEQAEHAAETLAERIKALLQPPLAGELRERIAQAIHDEYRSSQATNKAPDDPAMLPWKDLAEDLKESNRQQAEDIPRKLQRIGYTYVAARGQPAQSHQFTPEEVETLAEMEHARWVAERVKAGWKPGPRDPQKKLSPYLVPYEFLDEQVKEYDRQAVRAIPAVLERAGLVLRANPNWEVSAPDIWRELDEAARALDQIRVQNICARLIAELTPPPFTFPVRQARGILQVLRGRRFFALMESVAQALIDSGQNDAQIRRQLAQAQIDQGKLDAASAGLQELIRDTTDLPAENAEARGLLGRAYKQQYVALRKEDPTAAAAFLRQATECYYTVYRDRPKPGDDLWHGINAAALIAAAARHAIDLPGGYPDSRLIARQILVVVEESWLEHRADTWDCATASEACVALGDVEGALKWARLYAQSTYTGEFELASTLRQLLEIWELEPNAGPFAPLLTFLQTELLRQGRGHQEVFFQRTPAGRLDTPDKNLSFERVFADGRLESVAWFRNGYERASAVGRIDDDGGRAVGTGFLIRGGDLLEELGDERLFLTNSHVISDQPDIAAGQSGMQVLSVNEARIVFSLATGVPMDAQWRVQSIVWSSLPNELDATIIRLHLPPPPLPDFPAYTIARALPLADGTQPVWVFGHARGGGLSFSARNNVLVGCVNNRLRYRAATEGGSSGGPVFNNEWKLIGLHHAGGGAMQAGGPPTPAATAEWNEGISILALLEEIRQPAVRSRLLARALPQE